MELDLANVNSFLALLNAGGDDVVIKMWKLRRKIEAIRKCRGSLTQKIEMLHIIGKEIEEAKVNDKGPGAKQRRQLFSHRTSRVNQWIEKFGRQRAKAEGLVYDRNDPHSMIVRRIRANKTKGEEIRNGKENEELC